MKHKEITDYSTQYFNSDSVNNMKLPEVNVRKQTSKQHQTKLKLRILEYIKLYEIENNYQFEIYEIDNILLEIVKHHHESYLNTKFGYDTI
jgi:hypothetical protein